MSNFRICGGETPAGTKCRRGFLATMKRMRTTALWAFWRRLQYLTFFGLIILSFFVYVFITYLYVAPTCFDSADNGDETGVDCGGSCVRICAVDTLPPKVSWARSFRVTEGHYNAVAYVENPNKIAATPSLRYRFMLYDDQGLITERSGSTLLPPDSVYPIFESQIATGDRIPTRTFLELEPVELWQPAMAGREQFPVIDRELTGADSKPRIDATLQNTSLEEARRVEVVATIFDSSGNALNASETVVDIFPPRADTKVSFTWPEPIATTLRSCEVPTDVVVAIDVSGSMNDDGDNPPEPLTSVKRAASAFVTRLGALDQAGIVTFATQAHALLPLSHDVSMIAKTITDIVIDPPEEQGYTNTGEGFISAYQELVSPRHNTNARKVLVLLTDGLATAPDPEPEAYGKTQATMVKQAGVEVYAIGLGAKVNMDFVRSVATDGEHAYQALTAGDINTIYETITASLCEDGPATIDIVPKTGTSLTPLR